MKETSSTTKTKLSLEETSPGCVAGSTVTSGVHPEQRSQGLTPTLGLIPEHVGPVQSLVFSHWLCNIHSFSMLSQTDPTSLASCVVTVGHAACV